MAGGEVALRFYKLRGVLLRKEIALMKTNIRFYICLLLVGGLFMLNCGLLYAGDPVTKLGRGITNIATGWIEIPKEISKEVRDSDIGAFIIAPFKGFGKAIARTLAGALETVTFIIPLPRHYESVIEPPLVL